MVAKDTVAMECCKWLLRKRLILGELVMVARTRLLRSVVNGCYGNGCTHQTVGFEGPRAAAHALRVTTLARVGSETVTFTLLAAHYSGHCKVKQGHAGQ